MNPNQEKIHSLRTRCRIEDMYTGENYACWISGCSKQKSRMVTKKQAYIKR